MKLSLRIGSFSSASAATVLLMTHSFIIAGTFGTLTAGIAYVMVRTKSSINEAALVAAWPEVIDHLMSGIQSGLSLSESLAGLATRGPEVLRPAFGRFKAALFRSGDLTEAIGELRNTFAHHGSDQIFEALLIAKSLGGGELLQILRTLGDFLRQDLALRREIDVKHGWIKNSAHISAAAPWILLLLLSTQPSTATAYSTTTGALILLTGLLLTAIAYLWMNRLGRLPVTPRVFIANNHAAYEIKRASS
ncbi:MAG: type II secretion system protein F [Candidatus Planktophila sp.]|nr:type II secretion system protein F [Candidatus Planktophila sp.]